MRPMFIIGLIAFVVIAGFIIITNAPGPYDELARCLTEKGAKMYGSKFCSHCMDEKELFGNSWRLVNYVECYSPDSPSGQSEACAAAGITAYPTWEFGDGTKKLGFLPVEELAARSGCHLS